MVKQKFSDISDKRIVNNILYFPEQDTENKYLKNLKKDLKLYDCGKTKRCMGTQGNIYNCQFYNKCSEIKESLMLFL